MIVDHCCSFSATLHVETRDTLKAVTVNQENTVKLEEEIAEMQKRVDEAQEALKQMEAKKKQESQVVSDGDSTL